VTSVVLDASAVIAVLNSEPGAEAVLGAIAGALVSAVNYSEVLKKAIERCQTTGRLQRSCTATQSRLCRSTRPWRLLAPNSFLQLSSTGYLSLIVPAWPWASSANARCSPERTMLR